jgi:nicotinamide riboside kinase
MTIGFCGSHGTGKTTLADMLNEEFECIFNRNVSYQRLLNDICLPINDRTNIITQSGVLANYYIDLFRYREDEILLTDRTIIDALAYTFNSDFISTDDKNILYSYYAKVMSMYDVLFYIPIEFALVKDNLRQEDEQYRINIDNEIKRLLKISNIKYHIVSGNIEDRLEYTKEIIDEARYR